MNVIFPAKRKLLVKELLQGKEYATQLKFLLKNPIASHGSPSVKELMTNVLRSFSHTLSVINSSQPSSSAVNNSGEDFRSEDSSESRKRLLPTTTKDRRGSYKRRKSEETRNIVSQTTDDIHSWRKYGQKEILNSQFPRSYYRCTRKHDQGCKATKQVQRIEENPDMYQITYIGFHTCKSTLQTPQMVTFSDTNNNWDSFLVNFHHHSKVLNYDQHDDPLISTSQIRPNVKQEYLNDERSELTEDLLDPNLWCDLKDFELSKPAINLSFNNVVSDTVYSSTESQNLEIDFGVFSSDFSNDLIYFDESHLI